MRLILQELYALYLYMLAIFFNYISICAACRGECSRERGKNRSVKERIATAKMVAPGYAAPWTACPLLARSMRQSRNMHKCIAVSQMQPDTGSQIPRPDNTGYPFLPPPCNNLPPLLFLSLSLFTRFAYPESAKRSKRLFERARVYLMAFRIAGVI